jgi:hypothetical protein
MSRQVGNIVVVEDSLALRLMVACGRFGLLWHEIALWIEKRQKYVPNYLCWIGGAGRL